MLEEQILSYAISERASDIHLEPQEDGWTIRIRKQGVLAHYLNITSEDGESLVQRFKVKADMNISEKRLPQDGSLHYIDGNGEPIDLRLSSLPTIQGEKLTIRLLYRTPQFTSINQLGIKPMDYQKLLRWIYEPMGLILVAGPTGSGKTTTLYAILQHLKEGGINITTIEDPVEFRISGINQVQVKQETGLTFATGLRALLRHDPDVIMIGEIRDRETAEIATRSALTGHLVLASIHAMDASTAISRLMEMGIEPYLVTSSLRGVISQKMVYHTCPNCRHGKTCPQCKGTGYVGRRPEFDLLEVNERLIPYILNKRPASEIRLQANKMELFDRW